MQMISRPLISGPLALRAVDVRDRQERARLDAYVRAHPQGTPFHLPAWSVAVADACGQRSHILVAEHSDGTLAGMVPLTEIRSLLFGKALVSNGFAVGGGVLAENDGTACALADAAWSLAEKLGCPSLELRGDSVTGPEWIVDDHSYVGFTRPIAASDEAELAAIPRKQRAEVRKALESDLTVSTGCHDADARDHYAVYAESVRNLGTPVFPAGLFRAVLREFGESADILTVRREGRAVASVLNLYMNGTVYPYWGGGTHAARALRANDRMYFALMAHARAKGCVRFDFGRSKVGTGAAAFKKNWGFQPTPLLYVKRVAVGGAPREINPLNPRYRLQVEAWKKLPLWVANRVGPWIAKGLG